MIYDLWKQVKFCSLFVLLFFCLTSVSVNALTMSAYTLEELHAEATLIVRGHISKERAYREGGRIFTEFTITLSGVPFKGSLNTHQSPTHQAEAHFAHFSLLGGNLDGLTQVVPGAPKIKMGEELIVFLRCAESSHQKTPTKCVPVGMGQGLWKTQNGTWQPLTDHVQWVGDKAPLNQLSLESLTRGITR